MHLGTKTVLNAQHSTVSALPEMPRTVRPPASVPPTCSKTHGRLGFQTTQCAMGIVDGRQCFEASHTFSICQSRETVQHGIVHHDCKLKHEQGLKAWLDFWLIHKTPTDCTLLCRTSCKPTSWSSISRTSICLLCMLPAYPGLCSLQYMSMVSRIVKQGVKVWSCSARTASLCVNAGESLRLPATSTVPWTRVCATRRQAKQWRRVVLPAPDGPA